MRVRIVAASLVLALATSTSVAQGISAPPTRVGQLGVYGCPAHLEMQATWPARCPVCRTVLEATPPSASTPVGIVPVAGRYSRRPGETTREIQQDQQWRERARQNEQWRQWGQRNEELRQQARRNAELRERARRNEGFRQPPPDYGVLPPEGYAYPYPYNYYYNPNTRRYGFLRPEYAYPYPGYQYNPNPGLRYYNPNADQYYWNPNAGHYYYNPLTGQYQYVNPRDTYPYPRNQERRE